MTRCIRTLKMTLTADKGILVGAIVLAAGLSAAPQGTAESQAALVKQYCVVCHNDRAKTGNLSLQNEDLSSAGDHPEVWEPVIRKLRAGMMPPPGMARPPLEKYEGLRNWLEAEIDRKAVEGRLLYAAAAGGHPPRLEAELPLVSRPGGRCLMGSSFGAVASLATAYRYPEVYGSLLVQSGSFVFTDIANNHGGGPEFEPVVRFVNRYRTAPRRVADRMFVSCGVFEPLITPNRSMVPVFESTGMAVRYVEARDGHSWENWRDRLRAGLSWIFPGPQKFYYE